MFFQFAKYLERWLFSPPFRGGRSRFTGDASVRRQKAKENRRRSHKGKRGAL